MNTIKRIFLKNNQQSLIVLCLLLSSLFLLSARVAITQTVYFVFLIWNVFLATIPYCITMYLLEKNLSKLLIVFVFAIWLLFLTNAPYIITDLYHLKRSSHELIWLDTFVIITFALTGIVLFYESVNNMLLIINKVYNIKQERIVVLILCFLSAFGVYIGRFLRHNSWEIMSNPKPLLANIIDIITHPKPHDKAWLFTIIFGFLLSVGHFIFKRLKFKKPRI